MARLRLVLVVVGAFLGRSLPGPVRAEAPATAAQIQRGEYLSCTWPCACSAIPPATSRAA